MATLSYFAFAAVLDAFNLLDDFSEYAEKIGWDGQTFPVDLTNDSAEPLTFLVCVDDDCQSFGRREQVAPGETYPDVGKVDRPAMWLVSDLQGNVLGCFRIPFDKKYEHVTLRVSEIDRCP